ncbi:MAG: hypothetical protein ACK4IX_10375 [Candidatus Sericytochromatia bacterium]
MENEVLKEEQNTKGFLFNIFDRLKLVIFALSLIVIPTLIIMYLKKSNDVLDYFYQSKDNIAIVKMSIFRNYSENIVITFFCGFLGVFHEKYRKIGVLSFLLLIFSYIISIYAVSVFKEDKILTRGFNTLFFTKEYKYSDIESVVVHSKYISTTTSQYSTSSGHYVMNYELIFTDKSSIDYIPSDVTNDGKYITGNIESYIKLESKIPNAEHYMEKDFKETTFYHSFPIGYFDKFKEI